MLSRMRAVLPVIFLLVAAKSTSQSVRYLLTKDGLPQSFVSGLVQDDTSFIWIGTRNGLARFDGIQFKVFQHNARDTTTLASNLIIWIRRDDRNQLWIEYESGAVDVMNPVTEKIRHFVTENQINAGRVSFIRRGWFVDGDDIFWGIVKGGGLNNYDGHTGRSEVFKRAAETFASDTIRGITNHLNKGIWVLTDQQLSLYDKSLKKFSQWPVPFKQDYGDFPNSEAIAIDLHVRKNGELMWGDRKNLYFFQTATHQFRMVPLPVVSYLGIRWIRTGLDGSEYFENFGRVFRYDEKNGARSIGKTANEIFSDAKSFLVDRSGLIWLGTNAAGIQLIDLEIPFFQSYTYKKDFITDLLKEETGMDMRSFFNWTAADQQFSQPSYYVRSAYDHQGRLYLALKETVCYYDSNRRTFIKLPPPPLVNRSPTSRVSIRGISFMQNNAPVIAGYSGDILIYDSAGKKWNSFMDPGLLRKTFNPELLLLDILADADDLWVTSEKDGLFRINIRTKKITQVREGIVEGALPSNQLLGLTADPKDPGQFWIGSYQGLIRFNKKTQACQVFSLQEGLPDNTIYAVLPDHAGKFWVSTNKGICRFDPATYSVRAFHTVNGLPGDEFNRFHQFEFPDGRMSFGGTDGWTIFNPQRIKKDAYEPALAFTNLKINNQDVIPGHPKSALTVPLNALNTLTLPYEQNTLSFGFAGLEFSQPQDLQYRYKLEGYDNDWVNAGSNRSAGYTKIPPGKYTLLVNASNTSGQWSGHVRSFKLNIKPPWYSTKMAYLCYVIILAGLTWTLVRLRVNRLLLKQEMLMKEKESEQLKELDDMKSRFFSNITHEFRTPLTLIMGPAEQLKATHAQDPKQNKLADTILRNAKQLLVLINRLMDLSKLEAKALKLQEQRGVPADIVGSVVYSFEGDAENKQVRLHFEYPAENADGWFYADALERIVYNLVSNALKFTPAGGEVHVSLSADDKNIKLLVKDNGIGIGADKLPYIFDRFFQAGHQGLAKEQWDHGTGIGLSLVKELVTQMDGRIEVVSNVPGGALKPGTEFTVTMAFRREAVEHHETAMTPEADASSETATNGQDKTKQILLVEDNRELSGFIRSILSESYQIVHAENGAEGLGLALNAMPDLIISDVMMPVMDGYEMCRQLKADIRTSHIPVILLTAKVTQENLIEGLEKGADDYLTKPFHPTELKLRIHNLLARQEKMRIRLQEEMSVPGTPVIEKEPLPQDIFLTRLYELLDEHLDDDLFGVDQLTGLMNLSRSSLHRKLKALTGLSTTEVVRNYRLKRAALFLKEGYTSSDTAYKTGFGSPAYFTKSFREVYGMTPGDFVKSVKV